MSASGWFVDKLGICVVFLRFCSLSERCRGLTRAPGWISSGLEEGEGRFPPSLRPEGREVSLELAEVIPPHQAPIRTVLSDA